ncbi:hypothetical protein EGR_10322 [Echinococcus granulosus]|uniref:Uncharacterized protein n=1 Tax=Echinococcus granulosus TaxID=6210 RepID=W6U128_ECHGR|nr:hypothetical protein EGR_10322 [Echinococcus granulosus]EUB54815.1 hypothetical protein EGR_10322 [Echinococcus granulosus]
MGYDSWISLRHLFGDIGRWIIGLIPLSPASSQAITIGVGTASPNVASNYKEAETSAAYFIGQLVDIAALDSDLLCNEYLAHGTGQI